MTENDESEKTKPAEHEPPAGASTVGTWEAGEEAINYVAKAGWTLLRKDEKPAAELFSVSYLASHPDIATDERPVTFVFNGSASICTETILIPCSFGFASTVNRSCDCLFTKVTMSSLPIFAMPATE